MSAVTVDAELAPVSRRRRRWRIAVVALGLAYALIGLIDVVDGVEGAGFQLAVGLLLAGFAYRSLKPGPLAPTLPPEYAAEIRAHHAEHDMAETVRWVAKMRGAGLGDAMRVTRAALADAPDPKR